MNAPRVVMVSGQGPPTLDGVGDHTARLLDALKRRRPEWSWWHLCRRRRGLASPLGVAGGVASLRPDHVWPGTGAAFAAARLLRPDVLHVQDQVHSFWETDAAVRFARQARGHVVTTLHEFHEELESVRHTIDLVGASHQVIASDERTASRCLAHTGRAVDLVAWSPSNVAPPTPQRRPPIVPGLVATFGFLSAVKALDVVHDALAGLRSRGAAVRFRIVGPFDPGNDSGHKALARRLDSPWVEFTGALHGDRLTRALAEAQVMALPFADGASPRRTSLQAGWAFGLPVVTTPPMAPERAIRDGENCLLVPENGPDAWSKTIARVLDGPELARALREGALQTAAAFSWERLVDEHLAIYDRLLGDRKATITKV